MSFFMYYNFWIQNELDHDERRFLRSSEYISRCLEEKIKEIVDWNNNRKLEIPIDYSIAYHNKKVKLFNRILIY